MSGRITSAIGERVATLTIDRPERANALTPELAADLTRQLATAAADPEVRVVVLRGAGGRAFCAGFDLGRVGEQVPTGLEELMAALDDLPLPTVAVLDGPAVGAGLELACRCDLRVARAGVEVGIPAVRLGVAYRSEGLAALLAATPAAAGLILTGERRRVDDLPGFAHGVVAEGELEAVVTRLTEQLAAAAPAAMAYTLRAVRALRRNLLPEDLGRSLAEQRAKVLAGDDLAEAVRARREGREPRFNDRQTESR